MLSVQEKIKRYRQKRKISAEELGRELGVSGQTIYNWEVGRYAPSRLAIQQLQQKGVLN